MIRLQTALLTDMSNSLARFHTMLIEVQDLDHSGYLRFTINKSHAALYSETGFYARLQFFNRRCNYYMIVEGPVEKACCDDAREGVRYGRPSFQHFVMKCHLVQYFPDIQKNHNEFAGRLLRIINWLIADNKPMVNRLVFTN